MSKLKTPIDYKSLEAELEEAIRADELYRLQNDAKLRAIEQNVPTYEHFRQMVCAAHLNPVQPSDVKPNAGKLWNSVVNKNCGCTRSYNEMIKHERFNEIKCSGISRDHPIPITCEQFMKVWKSIEGYEDKFIYLKSIRNVLRKNIFYSEIPSPLFAELVEVCFQSVWCADNIEIVIEILDTLSKCNRFCLTVSFMEPKERKTCEQLFRNLLVKMTNRSESIKSLALIYGIALDNSEL